MSRYGADLVVYCHFDDEGPLASIFVTVAFRPPGKGLGKGIAEQQLGSDVRRVAYEGNCGNQRCRSLRIGIAWDACKPQRCCNELISGG